MTASSSCLTAVLALSRRARWWPGWSAMRGVSCAPVTHTSHPTWGYLLRTATWSAAWAPEFWTFPAWAAGVDLMFAEAAGWDRPIRFAGGTGGHMPALEVAQQARRNGVHRLVFAHLGRPTLRAMDAGERPPFGEWGVPGRTYWLPRRRPAATGHAAGGV